MAAGDEIQPVVKKGDGGEHQDPHKRADLKAENLQVGKVPGGTDQSVAGIVPTDVHIGDPHKFSKEADGVRNIVATACNFPTDMSAGSVAARNAQLANYTDARALVASASSPADLKAAQALVAGFDQNLPAVQAALAHAQNRLDALAGRTATA